jgi:hypothetical protein
VRLVVHNKPATVQGGHTRPCALRASLAHLPGGCEIVSAVAAPGATVTYTIVYPLLKGKRLRQTFTDRADARGHSLHVFNVPYLPPRGAKHGSAATVARVTVTARPAGAPALLEQVSFRFVVIRSG